MTLSQTKFDQSHPISVAEAIAEGRRASGYSLEELAITCGLTVAELQAIETGADKDEVHLRRVASALKLPQLTL